MTNQEVIRAFINRQNAKTPKRAIPNGYYTYEGYTLTSNGYELINYKTVIAKWHNGQILVNSSKYSTTTSKIQSQLKSIITQFHINYIETDENFINVL